MPPQHISPSAASFSPYSAATSQASLNVSAISFVLFAGSNAHASGLLAESILMMPLGLTPYSRSFCPNRQDFLTISTNTALSSLLPMAGPPQIGATRLPILRFKEDAFSAIFLMPSSDASISKCGSNNPRSMPSNLTPSTSALAVNSNKVSRDIGGSESGPLPTMPGHVAL